AAAIWRRVAGWRLPAVISQRPPGSVAHPAWRPRRSARGWARPAEPARSGTGSSASAAPTIVSRSSSVSASATAIIPARRARRTASAATPARTSASGIHGSGRSLSEWITSTTCAAAVPSTRSTRSSTVRPSDGNAGQATALGVRVAWRSATISAPTWPRSVESIFLNHDVAPARCAVAAMRPAPEATQSGAAVASRAEDAPAGAPVPAPVALKARKGRVLSVADAVKELDLIRPSRQKLAEDFTLPLVGGDKLRLSAQRGKVVLINFWATWCPPCREEMPAMERLWQQQKGQVFVLVALSVDADTKKVKPYLDEHKLAFPVGLDPK